MPWRRRLRVPFGPLPKGPDTQGGDRIQGSQHYSIRATWVDRHAVEVLPGHGSCHTSARVVLRQLL